MPSTHQRTPLEDFLICYHEQMNRLFPIDMEDMGKYFEEDQYSGYPVMPGGSVWISEGKAIYAMIRALRPRNIVEIGNLFGCSANHILSAVDANQEGWVTLVDIEDHLVYEILHSPAFSRRIMNSLEYLDRPLHHDLYVIDGDHSHQHTLKELQLIVQNSQVPCYIWAHDIFTTEHDPSCEVKKTWDMMRPYFAQVEYFRDSVSNCGFVIAKLDKI